MFFFCLLGRFHKEFLACREKADDVHAKISELMKEVNEARDKLKIAREERESWITDHNAAVSKEMKSCTQTPGFVRLENGKYLVDMPGLEDNDATNEYPNVTAIHMIFSKASSFQIVMMISKDQIESNRGMAVF